MRVYMRVRMIEEHRTPPEHDNRKREDSGKAGKPTYIGMIADNEKKYKKS